MIRDARKRGLKAPVLLMGYYNPLLSYGEERMLQALRFRNFCRSYGSVSSLSS
jgi:tryptophan synthase